MERFLIYIISENDTEYVITVYESDALKWSDYFTERR